MSILHQKQDELIQKGNPLAVVFTVDEINTLADEGQLLSLKFEKEFPKDFKVSSDLFECAEKIIKGDNIYRVLEFCMLKNRALVKTIVSCFAGLARENVY